MLEITNQSKTLASLGVDVSSLVQRVKTISFEHDHHVTELDGLKQKHTQQRLAIHNQNTDIEELKRESSEQKRAKVNQNIEIGALKLESAQQKQTINNHYIEIKALKEENIQGKLATNNKNTEITAFKVKMAQQNQATNHQNTEIAALKVKTVQQNQVSNHQNTDITALKQEASVHKETLQSLLSVNARQKLSLNNITNAVTSLKACTAPRVAFTATFGTAGKKYLDDGDTLVYDLILLNSGGGYDDTTGIFTCPEPGVYHFSIHAMGDAACLALHRNGGRLPITALYAQDPQYYASASTGATVVLAHGDTVRVVGRGATSSLVEGKGYAFQANIFTGHLVQGDGCI